MLVKLKDIATIVGGATPSTEHSEYYNGDIIWITPKDLSDNNDNKYIAEGERNITKLGFSKSNTNLIPAYNILISTRAPIGYIAINKKECCTNQGFKSLICDKSKVNVDYLYYLLKTQIKSLENLGTGTTFKEVSKEAIENFVVDLPDRKIQDKIVEILSNIDNQIERNNTMVKRLQDLATSTYSRWFNQFEFPNEDGLPYKSNGGKFIYNEKLKRNIPIEWEVKEMSHFLNPYQPKTISEDEINTNKGNFPVYGANGIIGYYNNKNHSNNEITITCRGNTCGNMLMTLPNSWITGNAMVIGMSKDFCHKEYIYYFLQFTNRNKYITGSAQPQITATNLGKMLIVKPNNTVLKMFDNIVLPIRKQLICLELSNIELNNLKSKLLPLLINGQLEV